MENMDRTQARVEPPLPFEWELERGRDQIVVLQNVSWDQYVAINDARDGRQPLFAYLDGELELVTVSLRHEFVKTLIARLVEAFAEETGAKLNGFGGATLRKKAKRAGCEPDEWYCVGKAKQTPDLAIEVVHTSGGIDKLEVYRRLGAREVWFFISGRFWIYRLSEAGTYREVARSVALPRIDLVDIARIIAATDDSEQTDAVRAYRRALRRRR